MAVVLRFGGQRLRFGGDNLMWSGHIPHFHTKLIIERALQVGAQLPSKLIEFDLYVRDMYPIWMEYHDLYHIYRGDGDVLFKSINLANPDWPLATPSGGVSWTDEGVTGNGTNGYINTNFNPILLVTGKKYQLNDASFGGVAFGDVTGVPAFIGVATGVNSLILYDRGLGNARINQPSTINTPWPDFSGEGFKCLSRISNAEIEAVNRDVSELCSSISSSIPNQNQLILRQAAFYSKLSVSSFFMGKSIPYSVSQEIRDIENADMARLGLPQIA